MTASRRRFLALAAAFAGVPATARAHVWRGRALGAEVSLTLRGPRSLVAPAMAETRRLLAEIEALFSLYDPDSALSRLNHEGQMAAPDPRFLTLMHAADRAHALTGGLFDPTVQPLWRARAEGGDTGEAMARIGWHRVGFDARRIVLGRGQALTFNGIAQGYATDIVTESLAARGARDMLVNIGEHRAVGGPWRLGLDDPAQGSLGTRTLHDGAIATSSPGAMRVGDGPHILHPTARPLWSSVSVEAPTATLADSLSTALTLVPRERIAAIKDRAGLGRVTLVDTDGDLTTV